MKKKLIVSIILALVIVTVLAMCLSGCNSKKSTVIIREYAGDGYSEIYAKLSNVVSGWIRVDSYCVYDNGVIVIETSYATRYGEIQKRKFVTDISQVTFQCTNDGSLL